MLSPRRVMVLGLALLSGVLACAVAACDTGDTPSAPGGSGDNVTYTDANDTVEMKADVGADSPFAPVDGGAYNKPDGYDPYGNCQSCKCGATDYCFGGGTGYTSFSGNCMPDAGFAIGCQPLPPMCAGDASCECLLQATASQVPCYAVCVQNTRTLYCPNP